LTSSVGSVSPSRGSVRSAGSAGIVDGLASSTYGYEDFDTGVPLPDRPSPPIKWADFRSNVCEVEVTRDLSDGCLYGEWEGERVIFPDMETSLDWVLSTPVETHLFEEQPIIKECPEDEPHH